MATGATGRETVTIGKMVFGCKSSIERSKEKMQGTQLEFGDGQLELRFGKDMRVLVSQQ